MNVSVHLVIAACFAALQSPIITEKQARSAADAATAAVKGDHQRFVSEWVRELRKIDRDFKTTDGLSLGSYSLIPGTYQTVRNLAITVRGPITQFGLAYTEALRKMEPVSDIEWNKDVAVAIKPLTIDSPNIERCVLMSDKKESIAPVGSSLKPSDQVSRSGLTVTVSEGVLLFPLSAFRVGATLTCIPTVGNNVVHTFTAKSLQDIK